MGLGELSMFCLWWNLSRVEQGSILLVDEPEAFASPHSQYALVDELVVRCVERELTVIVSTQTEAVHMRVLGKHSRGGSREDAYGMFGAVTAFKAMKAARPEAKPDDPLFLENHREGIKELLIKAKLRTAAEGRTRDAKSLRQTGISLRLDLAPNPDYRDIAKWARTSPAMIATFYDQTHPQLSVERIGGFRKQSRPADTESA